MIRQHLQFIDAQTLFVNVLAAGGMLQAGVHVDLLTDRPAGLVPQIHEIIVLVMLALQPTRWVRKEVRSERLGHLLPDRFKFTITRDKTDLVGLGVFHKFLARKGPADDETVRRLVVIFLI